MTIRMGVFGAAGRMGQLICEAVDADDELVLAAAIDPTPAEVCGFTTIPSCTDLDASAVDVTIDFTHIDAARGNARWCAANGVHAVIGTSGFTADDHDELGQAFTSSNCLIAPNFAIGAVLMIRFAELAAPHFDTAEIIEMHHDGKVDAPSGTAIETARRMAAASSDWAPDPTKTENLHAPRGAEGAAGIRVHAVRMRGMVASQEVLLGTMGQSLSIRHDTYDRTSFVPGVLLGAKRVADFPGLTVGLDAYLGL